MRNSLFFLALLALIVCAVPVKADSGDAFPPDVSYSGAREVAATACPSGRVLGWTGKRVVCVNPSYGVSTGCKTGQFLAKITRGVAECIWPVDAVCGDKQVLKELQNGSFACVGAGKGGELDIDCVTEGTALHKMADGVETCIKVTDNSSLTAECTEEGKVLRGINKGSPVCTSVGSGSPPVGAWTADCGPGRAMRRVLFGGSDGVVGIRSDGLLGDNYCDPDRDIWNQKEWTHLEYWKYVHGFSGLKKVLTGVLYERSSGSTGIPLRSWTATFWYGAGGVRLGTGSYNVGCRSSGKAAACPVGTVMIAACVCPSNGHLAVRCMGYTK